MRNLPPRPTRSQAGGSSGLGTFDRAVAVLEAVEGGTGTFMGIKRATGLPKPTLHRLLRALEFHGFVTHIGGRGYTLGPRLLQLAASSLQQAPLRDLAHPSLERLARVTGEGAQLFLAAADARVCVDSVQSSSELRTIVPIGARLPLWVGSAGKIFMAFGDPVARVELIERAEPLTPDTPVGERLERQIHAALRDGWASSHGERAPGVGSVSAPVRGSTGELLAVVSLSGPTTRIKRLTAKRYAPAVTEAAREIERALGVG